MRSFRATPRLTPRFPRRPVSADFAAALDALARYAALPAYRRHRADRAAAASLEGRGHG